MLGNQVFGTTDDCLANVHSSNTVISHNIIWGLKSGEGVAGDGIAVWGDSRNVTISNNIIHNISHHGLSAKLYEDCNPSDVTFSNNKIFNVGQNGLYAISTCASNDSMTTLTITDNEFFGCGYNGIRILVASYGTCVNNHIIDAGLNQTNSYYGIVIDYSAVESKYSNSWIVNNNIIRRIQATTVKYCIFLTGSFHACIGNIAYGAGTTNIQDSSTGSVVDHNQESGF